MRVLPHNLSATDAAGALLRPLPTVRTPPAAKGCAFSGELLLTTGSHCGPEGSGVDSLISGQFSDNDWLPWWSTCLHSCLKLGQLYGGVYAPEAPGIRLKLSESMSLPGSFPTHPFLALLQLPPDSAPPVLLLPRTGLQALLPGIPAKDTLLPNLLGVFPKKLGGQTPESGTANHHLAEARARPSGESKAPSASPRVSGETGNLQLLIHKGLG